MITIKDVEHVAKLARLSLTEDEKARYAEQLAKIIGYFDELSQVDTTGVEPMSHPFPILNVTREDEIVPPPGHAELLKNSPSSEGPFFKVPKIGE